MEEMEDHADHDGSNATVLENIETLFETIKVYGKTNLDLLKLKAVDKIAETVSAAFTVIVIGIIMLIFFILLSIGIALLLGEILGKIYYGFFALAGFYLIIGLILNSMKAKWFRLPIENMIVKKMFK